MKKLIKSTATTGLKNKYWLCISILAVSLTGCSDAGEFFHQWQQVIDDITHKEAPISAEEAARQKFRISLEDINFDISAGYSYFHYERTKSWPKVPSNQLNGRVRKEVDYIKIIVIVPNMDGYTNENSSKFAGKGWGNKVMASISHQIPRPWQYYFGNTFLQLKKQESSPTMQGMLRFHDPLMKQDVYLSHDYARPDLIKIQCPDQSRPKSDKYSPSCTVTAQYRRQLNFSYTFAREHLKQWRNIDTKLRQRFDSFIVN